MLPLSYLRIGWPPDGFQKYRFTKQSLHHASALAHFMAGRWRKLLEEESEHQWLAIGVFFLFVLTGAYAIGATEHFVGAGITKMSDHLPEAEGSLVLDVAYHQDSNAYTALVHAPGAGYHLFTEDVSEKRTTPIFSPQTDDRGSEVQFLKRMPNGEILFSTDNNQLTGIKDNLLITYEYPTENGEFGIHDVAEKTNDDTTQRLLLTHEGAATSFRGISGMMPTSPMSMTSGVQWQHLEPHTEDLWLALGIHISTAGADGSSPATPQSRPALGWIAWDGSNSTPVLQEVRMSNSGIFHSIAHAGDTIVVGGTEESLILQQDGEVSTIDVGCTAAIADDEGRVWFIGDIGAPTIATYEEGELETHVLSRPLPVDMSNVGFNDQHILVHGTDADGAPILWTIDVQADGSIESGRGFLNLLFLLAGGVLLGMMILHGIEQLRREE